MELLSRPMPGSSPPRASDLLGVAAVSAGILLLELGLTRLLSVTTWYHFAFFAISLALMGLGAGENTATVNRLFDVME